MKKTITQEREICDFCDENDASYMRCMGCRKAMCYDCRKIHAKEYAHAVHFGGSEDGLYCLECDTRLITANNDKLHRAYRTVEALRAESKAWWEEFKVRSDKAEEAVKRYKSSDGVKP